MIPARQSTALETAIGPVLDASGVAVTDCVVGDFKLKKTAGNFAALNASATLTHVSAGVYDLVLTTSDTDTVGLCCVAIDDTTNACGLLYIQVIEEAVYDALYAASALGYVANAPVNVAQLSGDSTAADNAEAFFDGTGYAGTGNVIPTVTTLTNLPAITSSWLTAAGLAADAGVEIAAAVWDRVLNAANHNIASSAGRRLRQLDASSILSGTAAAGASNSITLDGSASATDDIYDGALIVLTGGTGAGQTRIIVEYNGTTKVAIVNRVWVTTPSTDSTYDLVADDQANIVQHGLAQAGGATSITLSSAASAVDDIYVGCHIYLSTSTGTGQTRLITAYNGTTKVATVSPAWQTNPSSASVYNIIPVGRSIVESLGTQAKADVNAEADTALSDVGLTTTVTGRIDAAVTTRMATYTQPTGFLAATFPTTVASTTNITAASGVTISGTTTTLDALQTALNSAHGSGSWATATGFSTHSAADVWAAATRTLTAGTNIQLPSNGLANVTAWTVAITGNITGNLSGSVGSVTSAVTITGDAATAGTRFLTMIELDTSVYRYTTNALEQAASGGASVADITAGVWNATAASYNTAGTMGQKMNAAGGAADPLTNAVPGSYVAGTAGYALGSLTTIVGTGSVSVNHNYGSTNALTYRTSAGAGIDNATVTAYLAADYTAGNLSDAFVQGRTRTNSSGQWERAIMLDPGSYTIVFYKQGYYGPDAQNVTVS